MLEGTMIEPREGAEYVKLIGMLKVLWIFYI